MRPLQLEIAVSSPEGAAVALAGGADRVELCCALELGGLTPSQGLVEETLATGARVHALVRCRPGDFLYDAAEVATMVREVRSIVDAGVQGVVIGALRADHTLDELTTCRLIEAARLASPTIDITFHRAIDQAADPVSLLESLAGLGVNRILTSGGQTSVSQGLDTIARLSRAAGPIEIMAGGGLTPGTIPAVVTAGATSLHLSAKHREGATDRKYSLGSMDTTGMHFVTDPRIVRQARRAINTVARTEPSSS